MSSSGSSIRYVSLVRGLFVAVVAAALGAGCATARREGPPLPSVARPGGLEVSGRAVARTALAYRGVPYRTGGADPSGFDCSGLVQFVLAQHGLAVPRVVEAQARIGRRVDRGGVEAGDLVFFKLDGRPVSHVGIALDNRAFVHAPKEPGTVRVESLDTPYWARRFAGARRVRGVDPPSS